MTQGYVCQRIAQLLASGELNLCAYETLAALKLPGADYRGLLAALHAVLEPRLYVEIGVRVGNSLLLADPQTECIGIDPHLTPGATSVMEGRRGILCASTSDAFFCGPKAERAKNFDFAFIDGEHSLFQALKDFENLERLAHPGSLIAIHDVIPMDERTATPECNTDFHTGDVWRLMMAIVAGRPDLIAFTVACPPSGLGLVGRFGDKRGIPGQVVSTIASAPFPRDWDELAKGLNVVANEPASILAALDVVRGAA